MNVTDFLKLDKAGAMFRVVDASQQGYMTTPKVLTEADKNVVKNLYGFNELIGFALISKRTMIIYIDPTKED